MRIGNIEISRYKEALPPEVDISKPFQVVTQADSYLYEVYSHTPYNPNRLYEKKGSYELFDEMREDDQISPALNLKKYLVLSSPWSIECEKEEVTEFIERNLNEWLDEIFIKKMYNILSAMDYGFSLTELVFAEKDGQIILSQLKTRAPHSFDFVQDKFGEVEKVIQYTTEEDLEIDPSKFIHYVYQEEFDNPYGKSDLDMGVYRAYWSKNAVIKFLNIYLERHGMPLGIGTVPQGTAQAKVEEFKKIGKNIQAKTFGVMPEGFSIDFLEASKGTDGYDKAIDKYNLMIARSMLVPDLLGFSGSETSGGSYALGEEQGDIFFNILGYIQQQLERLITDKIVQPLALYNFGNVEAKFKFMSVDEKKKTEQMKMWLDAVKSGKIPITNTHINWFLKNVDAPEIDEAELEAIEEERKAQAEAIAGVNPEEDPGKDSKKDEKKKDNDKPVEKEEKTKKKEFEFNEFRELTDYEKDVNFQEISNDLDQIEDKYIEDLTALYNLSINGVIDEVKRKKIIERKRFDLIDSLTMKHLNRIESNTAQMINVSFKRGENSVREFQEVLLDDSDIADWIKQSASYVTEQEEKFIMGKIKATLSEGIRAGDGVRDIITTIETVLAGYNIDNPFRVELVVRTNTLAGYNEGRAQQFSKLTTIKAYQYSAIMDGRTSAICTALDETIFQPSELSYYNPPNHFNCRSIIVPIFKEEKIEDNPPPATERSSTVGGNFLQLPKEE